MAERELPREERERTHDEGLQRDEVHVGTGLGGGVAPILPTDLDGHHPDTDWLASSDKNTQVPNWAASEELAPGPGRLEGDRDQLQISADTHLVTVFGDDIGKVEELYGYPPSNDPQWAVIKDGDRRVLVPLMSGQFDDEGFRIPYPKNLIESAPELPQEGFSVEWEMGLYGHYNERRILPAADGSTQGRDRTLQRLRLAA